MTSADERNILISLFQETGRKLDNLSKRRFLAKHHSEVAEVERLIDAGVIQCRDGKHLRLPLVGLATLAETFKQADSLFYLCGHLFNVLRSAFIRNPDEKLTVRQISVLAEMPEHDVARAFSYLVDAPICESLSIDVDGFHSEILISSSILRYQSLSQVIHAMSGVSSSAAAPYEDAKAVQSSTAEWDVFISHASEDKQLFVRPLAEALKAQGLRVWYDELTLTVGDSLRRSIDGGLARSRFGIVVISPDFMAKEWAQKELDGLVSREIGGQKVILPVWHNITADKIRVYSPTLADRLAVSSEKGLPEVTAKLLEAIRRGESPSSAPLVPDIEAVPTYAEHVKADVDFPISKRSSVSKLILDLRTYTYSVQNPAVEKMLAMNWGSVNVDEAFVLGRNLYQTAVGGERTAIGVLKDFRRYAASTFAVRGGDLLSGMLFEAYFNSKGKFRGSKLKTNCLKGLLALREVDKFQPAFRFIDNALKPYRSQLPTKYRIDH